MAQLEEEDHEKLHRVITPEESFSCSDSDLSPSERKWKKYQKEAEAKERMIKQGIEKSKPRKL